MRRTIFALRHAGFKSEYFVPPSAIPGLGHIGLARP
jgi:hypothetical protein